MSEAVHEDTLACPNVGMIWPDASFQPASGELYSVEYIPLLRGGAPAVIDFVRRVTCGPSHHEEVLWRQEFATGAAARRHHRWMQAEVTSWTSWGRHLEAFGPDAMIGAADVAVAAHRAQLLVQRLRERRTGRERARERLRREQAIESYLIEKDGWYGLDLRRGGKKKGFFKILFRERWERERFRDWFRCQRARFSEFAAYLEAHGAIELERMLLREMLATEKRVKSAGEGAGGRRPLRFYRGDE